LANTQFIIQSLSELQCELSIYTFLLTKNNVLFVI